MPIEDESKKPIHEGGLEDIEQKLYSNEALEEEEVSLSGPKNFAPSEWAEFHFKKPNDEVVPVVHKKNYFLNWLLGGSVVFFVASLGIASYMFFGGKNVVSEKNVLLKVDAPTSISGGESTLFQITIENQNEITLLDTDLLIEYPEGTRDPEDLSKDVRRYRETLGDLVSGGKITKKINVVFFGESGNEKDINVTLAYKVKGSNATFTKKDNKKISLSNSPVAVSISSPGTVGMGSEASFVVDIEANSSLEAKNLMLSVDYPFGFSLLNSEPEATYSNNVWDLGDLKPGSKRQIIIRGQFEGNPGEERAVRFLVGSKDPKNPRKIGVPFLSKNQSVLVTKPSIDLRLTLGNADLPEYITNPGTGITPVITLANGLSSKITNLIVTARLSGNIFDKASVDAQNGFFKSSENLIIWNQRSSPDFAFIEPGMEKNINFSFLIPKSVSSVKNPSMEIIVTATAEYSDESTGIEQIKVSTTKTIKLASDMTVGARIVYSTGPFENRGPVPPRQDQETTYTVILSLKAGANGVTGGRVTTSLPIYVDWLNKVDPDGEKIMFNTLGGGVVWEVGDLAGGQTKESAFQIAFKPSANQVNNIISLLNGVSATGKDAFSGLVLTSSVYQSQDISMPQDPLYVGRGGPVSK
jgi:hypothetical protein